MSPTPIDIDTLLMEMRWRCLSLAADLDRLDRLAPSLDPNRLHDLRAAMAVLTGKAGDRAARVQMLMSDTTPPPAY